MYKLTVIADFDAAHRLPEYNGPCRRVHGHRWVIKATYIFREVGRQGMACDLVALKRILSAEAATYDHQSLNSIMNCTPTAENIARVIYNRLSAQPHGRSLHNVSVHETPDTCVEYFPGTEPTGTQLNSEDLDPQTKDEDKEPDHARQ